MAHTQFASGVKFEPGTAESVTCESGESYRVEALQDVYNLGLDFNNAHVQPTGEYHYHGVSELLADAYATEDDLVHVGFAADGYLMYYSKSGAYASGYELSTESRVGSVRCAPGPGPPCGSYPCVRSGRIELCREGEGMNAWPTPTR